MPFPAPVAVVNSEAITAVTSALTPLVAGATTVFVPLVFVATSAMKFTLLSFKAVPTKLIVSSCSTSTPLAHPLKTTFVKIAFVPLLNLIA